MAGIVFLQGRAVPTIRWGYSILSHDGTGAPSDVGPLYPARSFFSCHVSRPRQPQAHSKVSPRRLVPHARRLLEALDFFRRECRGDTNQETDRKNQAYCFRSHSRTTMEESAHPSILARTSNPSSSVSKKAVVLSETCSCPSRACRMRREHRPSTTLRYTGEGSTHISDYARRGVEHGNEPL